MLLPFALEAAALTGPERVRMFRLHKTQIDTMEEEREVARRF